MQPAAAHPRSRAPVVALGLLFLALTWPAILWGHDATSEAFDEREYHLPVIQTMAAQWPRVDLVNYRSATSPGYHLTMALLSRFVASDLTFLRLISSLFGLGLVLAVLWHAQRHIGGGRALISVAPLLGSSYLLSGSIWLTTDNAAWLCVALALGGVVMLSPTAGHVVRSSIFVALAVFVRQIHIWTIAPIALAGWSAAIRGQQPRLRASLVALLIPCALLGTLVLLWKGLMPPAYAHIHARGVNPATAPMVLSLLGLFGIFFLPTFSAFDVRAALRDPILWAAICLALVLAVVVPTSSISPDTPEAMALGRWGGPIWMLAGKLPPFAERNLVFPPLAMLGAAVLVIGWRRAAVAGKAHHASLLLFGLACWLAAQSMNTQAWQRYCEPMVLIVLAWLAALAASDQTIDRAALRRWLGPALLALIQLFLAYKSVYEPLISGVART